MARLIRQMRREQLELLTAIHVHGTVKLSAGPESAPTASTEPTARTSDTDADEVKP